MERLVADKLNISNVQQRRRGDASLARVSSYKPALHCTCRRAISQIENFSNNSTGTVYWLVVVSENAHPRSGYAFMQVEKMLCELARPIALRRQKVESTRETPSEISQDLLGAIHLLRSQRGRGAGYV